MKNISTDLSNKIKTPFQTPANNADPKMSMTVVRAKDTIMDNTYWTTEVIRMGADLGDVSVAPRRFTPYGSPNSIYEIHVQNGSVSASIREYPDKLKEGWKEQFTLGPGKSVGIAFDGEWKRYRQTYRLVTYEKPWISWVDLNGVLWVQRWDEEDTRLQLSTDVVKVRMIRAWKNTAIKYLDQGIVVAYIKSDGKVYYRNYCIQIDYTEAWEYEKVLIGFLGSAVNVNLFITNDYRMGFIIEDNTGQIHWLITNRNWGGMASPAENIVTGIKDITLEIVPVEYYDNFADNEYISTGISDMEINICPFDFDISQVTIASAKRIDDHKIKLVFSHSLLNADQSTDYFSIANKNIDSVSYGNSDKEIIINTVDSLPSIGVYTVNYNGEMLKVLITSVCKPKLPSFAVDITGDPPEHNIYINVGITVPTMNVKRVYYLSTLSPIENLNACISSMTLIVTKIGNNPL